MNTDFDWYDYDEVEKFKEKYTKQLIKVVKEMHDAKEKNDEKALMKAREAFRKYRAKNGLYKQKAEEAGYYWI